MKPQIAQMTQIKNLKFFKLIMNSFNHKAVQTVQLGTLCLTQPFLVYRDKISPVFLLNRDILRLYPDNPAIFP